jgi:Na+-translocating ferredoxin:NAD+ oxidoreductase RNF subunit RnfB
MAETVKINDADKPTSPSGKKPSPRVAFVNFDQCTGCEACIAVAPWDNCLVRVSTDPNTSNVKTNNDACTGCTLCMKICPWDAITMVPRPAS